MNNGLDLSKYLKSINSQAALHAVNDKNINHTDNESDSQSNINLQFNQDSSVVRYTKIWTT